MKLHKSIMKRKKEEIEEHVVEIEGNMQENEGEGWLSVGLD